MVNWHDPHDISNELGASISFRLSIVPVYSLLLSLAIIGRGFEQVRMRCRGCLYVRLFTTY